MKILKRLMESKHDCLVAVVDESNRSRAEQYLDNNVSLPTMKASEVPPETPPKGDKD